MADTAVTAILLAESTLSADLLTPTEGSTEVADGNVAVITPLTSPADHSGFAAKPGRLVLVFHEDGGGAATIAMVAGDKPPAMHAGLADTATKTVPTNDCLIMVVDPSIYLQDDGTIRITVGGQSLDIGAYQLPDGM